MTPLDLLGFSRKRRYHSIAVTLCRFDPLAVLSLHTAVFNSFPVFATLSLNSLSALIPAASPICLCYPLFCLPVPLNPGRLAELTPYQFVMAFSMWHCNASSASRKSTGCKTPDIAAYYCTCSLSQTLSHRYNDTCTVKVNGCLFPFPTFFLLHL